MCIALAHSGGFESLQSHLMRISPKHKGKKLQALECSLMAPHFAHHLRLPIGRIDRTAGRLAGHFLALLRYWHYPSSCFNYSIIANSVKKLAHLLQVYPCLLNVHYYFGFT